MTRFMFFEEPPDPRSVLSASFSPSAKRKKKKVGSLPLVLFNDCFVVQDVQEISAFVT